MALALSPLPLSIAVIDAVLPEDSNQPSFDDRSVALSYGSKIILQSIGLWPSLQSRVEAIKHIHVSDKGHMGICRLHADDYQQEALGYVLENRVAGQVLHQALMKQKNIDFFAPAQVRQIQNRSQSAVLSVEGIDACDELHASLVIAADGSRSPTGKLLGMEKTQHDYEQMALICNITSTHHSRGWAYERFTDSGPLAFLPLTDKRIAVVWSFLPQQQSLMQNMTDDEFRQALQKRFGYRVGTIQRVGKRVIYPLGLQQLKQGFQNRVVFIGNALHTGHPVAGQGFNLGLRDVAQLTEEIAMALAEHQDLADKGRLNNYWQQRQSDIADTLGATDGLARLFANPNRLLTCARNLTLKWLDQITPLKSAFANQAMGLRSDLPSLARGITLADPHYWSKLHANNSSVGESLGD